MRGLSGRRVRAEPFDAGCGPRTRWADALGDQLGRVVRAVALGPALDRTITAQLDAQFEDDLRRSERITARRWQDRAFTQRVAEKATTVIHRWL